MNYPCERDPDLSRIEDQHLEYCEDFEPGLEPIIKDKSRRLVFTRRTRGTARIWARALTSEFQPSRERPKDSPHSVDMLLHGAREKLSSEEIDTFSAHAIESYVDYSRDKHLESLLAVSELAIDNC